MRKIAVGITGQSGFIGTHLSNYLKTKPDETEFIPFSGRFNDPIELSNFASHCDVIIHLAAMNRGDPDTLYNLNISLVKQLIASLERLNNHPHIIFASSTQEALDNPYGRSKLEGRKLLEEWAQRNHSDLSCLVIPNVFGPFGKPFFNSVTSTFCYQLTHNQQPKIEIDAEMKLIYINNLVRQIYEVIVGIRSGSSVTIEPDMSMKVSDLLSLLNQFKQDYFEKHIVPDFRNLNELNFFNTFRSYIDPECFPVIPDCNRDNRGYLIELVKELSGGQTFFSSTIPGITRGNHFHMRKIERFCVIGGEASIKLRRIGTDKVTEYILNGNEPSFIDIPVFYTHNITNIGKDNLLTLFWTNEIFNPDDTDTFYEDVSFK